MNSEQWRAAALLVLCCGACGVTPLTNKIDVEQDAFVVGVGEGPDSATDLFAAPAAGGGFVRLTFNRAEERGPRFAPAGTRLAYLRRVPDSPRWSLVVLDLSDAGEHNVELPGAAGEPEWLGWSADGSRLVVRARELYWTAAPPNPMRLLPIDSAGLPAADSATRERLGTAGAGLITPCDEGLCVQVGDAVTPLGPGVTGAIRWGPDSLGYFRDGQFEVRPLGGGTTRRPLWKSLPSRLRELSYHAEVR